VRVKSSIACEHSEPTTIDNLDALVEGGHIVPLDSALSPLYQQAASGEMPPPGSGLPPLPHAELDILACAPKC